MNTILVLIDSLNRDALSAYGSSTVATPNLDRFAARSWRFDEHFVGSLPCMPARREIFTGRREMMWRPWGPLEPFDLRLPVQLRAHGLTTGIVTDHYHYWEEAANGYVQSFDSCELIRGHEMDAWKPPLSNDAELPAWIRNIETHRPGKGRRYYANVHDFASEEDYFPAKVFTAASSWLREYAGAKPFFLQVESFDVHEPFDVPDPYRSMYAGGADRDRFNVWPPYQDPVELEAFMATTTAEELDFLRAQYAGKLTMVDRWFGELLGTLDEEDLWDQTAVILTTDHGHDLGARGTFGKQWPHYDSHANIPLFVWHPEYPGDGRSTAALSSTVDLFATLLELGDAPVPAGTHSRSLLPVLRNGGAGGRDAVVYGTFGQGVGCTDGEWTLLKSPVAPGPLFSYSSGIFQSLIADTLHVPSEHGRFIRDVQLPQWKVPVTEAPLSHVNHLFHRRNDRRQERDLWNEEREERDRMLDLTHAILVHEGAPAEQFERLGLGGSVAS